MVERAKKLQKSESGHSRVAERQVKVPKKIPEEREQDVRAEQPETFDVWPNDPRERRSAQYRWLLTLGPTN
jgi:hypothetical protein